MQFTPYHAQYFAYELQANMSDGYTLTKEHLHGLNQALGV